MRNKLETKSDRPDRRIFFSIGKLLTIRTLKTAGQVGAHKPPSKLCSNPLVLYVPLVRGGLKHKILLLPQQCKEREMSIDLCF